MNKLDHLGGRFIVLDGPDGGGKSTQLAQLGQWLTQAGVPVTLTRDPGGTAIGDRIRQVLLDARHQEMAVATETLLYMASRAQLAHEIIAPQLARGACVLCDRFVSATIAYQGAGGADVSTIGPLARFAVGALVPDLTIVLDVPAEVGLARGKGGDRMESKALEFHRRVRQSFLDQAAAQPDRFAVVNAARPADEVQQDLRKLLIGWEFAEREFCPVIQ